MKCGRTATPFQIISARLRIDALKFLHFLRRKEGILSAKGRINTNAPNYSSGALLLSLRGDLDDIPLAFEGTVWPVALVHNALCMPGNDLLSHILRCSTIGAGAFHGRVRDGIGCSHSAIITRQTQRIYKPSVFVLPLSGHSHYARSSIGPTQCALLNESKQVYRVISTG